MNPMIQIPEELSQSPVMSTGKAEAGYLKTGITFSESRRMELSTNS